MGKQKNVATGRKPGRSRGGAQSTGRRGGGPRGRSLQSATPASEALLDRPTPKLLLRPLVDRPDSPVQEPFVTPGNGGKEDQDDELPQQFAPPPSVTTRTGRAIHKPQQYDAVNGSDIDAFIDQTSEDAGDHGGGFMASDPPYVSRMAQEQLEQPPKPRGSSSKDYTPFDDAVGKVDEEDGLFPSSNTLQATSTPVDTSLFVADDDIYSILNNLRATTKIHLDLPCLSDVSNPHNPLPYSAKTLTQLYVLCYQEKLWDLCDMIADTWIRDFHSQRRKSEDDRIRQIWHPNPALNRRKRKAQQAWEKGQDVPAEFDPNPKDYDLIVTDPELDIHVTSVNTDLLNTLYSHTSPRCGARLLWADALALGGDKTEKTIQRVTEAGFDLHPQLLFDIMQTSLRMVRRNLTLKIEESTEGAWCKRYHEHGKNKRTCYRERASGIREDGENAVGPSRNAIDVEDDMIESDILEAFEAGLEGEQEPETSAGHKRGFQDDNEVTPNKRARFVGDEEDAEGDSEEN